MKEFFDLKIVRLGYPKMVDPVLVEERPRALPRPSTPPPETVFKFEGEWLTSEQITQKKIADGRIYKLEEKVRRIAEYRQPRLSYRLGGPPQPKTPLIKVELLEFDVYKEKDVGFTTHLRNRVVLQTWTPEEWEKIPLAEKKALDPCYHD